MLVDAHKPPISVNLEKLNIPDPPTATFEPMTDTKKHKQPKARASVESLVRQKEKQEAVDNAEKLAPLVEFWTRKTVLPTNDWPAQDFLEAMSMVIVLLVFATPCFILAVFYERCIAEEFKREEDTVYRGAWLDILFAPGAWLIPSNWLSRSLLWFTAVFVLLAVLETLLYTSRPRVQLSPNFSLNSCCEKVQTFPCKTARF